MGKHIVLLGLFVHVVALAPALADDAAADRDGIEFFESRVRPVLVTHCFQCHSTEAKKLKADLRLDSRELIVKGGVSGPAIIPHKPAESLLIQAVNHNPASELRMPPKGKLPASVIADLTTWVQLGAPWPSKVEGSNLTGHSADHVEIRRTHWAFRPLNQPAIPAVHDRNWVRTPIDAFVLARLEAAQINPTPPADSRTLLRRVYLDLIGLPPTPQEQRAFLDDSSPDALARVVDCLLSRPQYGERWGRHWLDVARFAESQGYERDEPKPHAWRYRDYVINAFNQDKPYDRFVVEQLAGDELDDADAESQTALSFLRLGPFDTIAADAKLARYDQLDDVLGTTTAAFLGQTIRCARCHDHKFEPYSQNDYYKLLAIFDPLSGKNSDATHLGSPAQLESYRAAQARIDAEVKPLEERRDALLISILEARASQIDGTATAAGAGETLQQRPLSANVLAVLRKPASERTKQDLDTLRRSRQRIDDNARPLATADQLSQLKDLDGQVRRLDSKRPAGHFAYIFAEESSPGKTPPATHVFLRGDVNKLGPQVTPAVPGVLGGDDFPPLVPTSRTSGRRLSLARWITGPGQSLAARVMVNRIWQYHFGTGIVATSNDFGLHGESPTHPELLEWLAAELVAGNWSIKHLHRSIVLSSVYQTSASHRTNSPVAASLRDASPQPSNRGSRLGETRPLPDGKLLCHWRTRRLESEAVRDSILAVSGRMNLELRGPSVFPPLAQKLVGASAGLEWKTSDPGQASRRSVYVYVKRNIAVPELDVMGTADASASMDRRAIATTALQSLMLLNSRFTNENAIAFADRVQSEAGDDPLQQIRLAFELALCRLPSDSELSDAIEFLHDQAQFARSTSELPLTPLASFCLVLFNTNEFIYMK